MSNLQQMVQELASKVLQDIKLKFNATCYWLVPI
uniref:Uncharacterized protein n=1 Tax=Arundo donax TaxID=35708 RepID=A0A0A9B967_ARUDO